MYIRTKGEEKGLIKKLKKLRQKILTTFPFVRKNAEIVLFRLPENFFNFYQTWFLFHSGLSHTYVIQFYENEERNLKKNWLISSQTAKVLKLNTYLKFSMAYNLISPLPFLSPNPTFIRKQG